MGVFSIAMELLPQISSIAVVLMCRSKIRVHMVLETADNAQMDALRGGANRLCTYPDARGWTAGI